MSAVTLIDRGGVVADQNDGFAAPPIVLPGDEGFSDAGDMSARLLRAIAGTLDIRMAWPQISQIVGRILPHDYLALTVHDHLDRSRLEAHSIDGYAHRARGAGEASQPVISRDLRRPTPWLSRCDPPDVQARLVAAGYRSMLGVGTVALDEALRLAFFSKQPDAYGPDAVGTARHIAEHIAVAVAHQQLATAECRRAEAHSRAERLAAQVRSLTDEGGATSGRATVIGRSDAWRKVLAEALRVAVTDTTVFLQGESGTGKEVMARLIHEASPRKDGPFVAVNCAALPEQLLESELFGHERGAFTGADHAKPGQIEVAARGVLFLDEVTEMSPMAQAKFLRFLQEREFHRLGSTRVIRANVRVIAASNRDLGEAVEQGLFREDLFYRLQVFDIALPPLRERCSDVALMAEAFLQEFGRSLGRPPAALSPEARDALTAHPWPGNVRELRNVLERAAILCDGEPIARRHLSLRSRVTAAPSSDLSAAERQTIEKVLHDTDWNKAKAARRLGLTRTQLYVRLRKYALDNPLRT
jgi:transcriptional regulator with GAF, ATPase, and Fis domain